MNAITKFSLICLITISLAGCSDGDLSRSKALGLLKAEGFLETVIVKHEIAKDSKFSKLTETGKVYLDNNLIEPREFMYVSSGFLGRKSREFIKLVQPTSNLAEFIEGYFTVNLKDYQNKNAGHGYQYFLTHVADIENIDIVGIRTDADDQNKRIVEIKLNARATDVGKFFYSEEFEIPHFAEFVLYDDGWRFENSLFDEAKAKSGFVKNELSAYRSNQKLDSSVLWNMHKLGVYSEEWQGLAKQVEKSDKYWMIGSAAWAYHDHGMKDKAIGLYEDSVLPAVQETKDAKKITSFNEYYEKLKNTGSNLARLQSEREVVDKERDKVKAQIKILKEMEELEKQAKTEKKARLKAEREKAREVARKKREAENVERKRISSLKKLAITKTKSFGKFKCQTSLKAASMVEVSDVGFKSISDSVLERCGDISFLHQKGDLVKSQCYSSYGKKYPCVAFKTAKSEYLKSDISFASVSDREKFFLIASKSLKAWREKYSELLK